jgi:hypothetical protein
LVLQQVEKELQILFEFLSYKVNIVVAELEGSTPLIPNPGIGHDLEPVPSISYPHNLSP